MFEHKKQLLRPVAVEAPNPTYAAMLQEQLGGPQGEMKAAMQYFSQSMRIANEAIRDLFLDIAAEELGHMEMVAETVRLLYGDEVPTHAPTTQQLAGAAMKGHTLSGLSPMLADAGGVPWTASYISQTGDAAADLLANIAAEQGAKVVYQHLHRQIDDRYVRETIDFLLNREEAHNALFREALNDIADAGSQVNFGVDEQARLYFDLSEPGQYYEAPVPTAPRFTAPTEQSGGRGSHNK